MSAALEAGKRVYVTSAWGDLTIGQPIRSSMDLPPCKPFALRLVSLPASFGPEVTQDTQRKTADLLVPGASVQEAEVLPPVSSFSPERNIVEQLTLVRADGSVKETLACFQMLAQLMELPFRRDSIEQILEDHLRRGLNPNLQLCGQLAVSLGLHVMASRVPPATGTRLQVPSMLAWKSGFALVIASSERELKLASPAGNSNHRAE